MSEDRSVLDAMHAQEPIAVTSVPTGTTEEPARSWWQWLLFSPTGPGPVEDYDTHAMNPRQDPGLSRMIRGVTGLLGDLNLAIVDILFGLVEWLPRQTWLRRQPPAQP